MSSKEADEGIFEFRLFASRPQPAAGRGEGPLENHRLPKVNIRSPTPLSAEGKGGFVVPFRAASYYFTGAGDEGNRDWERRRAEYADVALGGEEVMSLARSTAWVR